MVARRLSGRSSKSLQLSLMMLASAVLATATVTTAKAEINPGPNDRFVTGAVTELLNSRHLSRRSLDDEISKRAFQTYFDNLDPMKVYFYQSDIDEFSREQLLLDDYTRSSDISFAYRVFNRFLQRLDERIVELPALISMEHDFDVKEELIVDPDKAAYSQTPDEAKDRWRKRIKYELLNFKDDDVEKDEAIDRLNRRYSSYAKRMQQYKSDDILEIYLSAITTSYDPHTTYMSPTTLENFNIQMKLNLDGIGAALSMQDGYTVISRIIPGGAADKQGDLTPESRITAVGQGTDGELVDVVDMRLNDVVQLIRGKAGSIVRLAVRSPEGESSMVQIIRDRIELKDSEARGEVISSNTFPGMVKANGLPYRVGVVKLPSFYLDMEGARRQLPNYKSTTRDVRRIINEFKQDGIDAVLLDLRFNGGGSLTEAIQLTGLFIDQGPVVQVKDPTNNIQRYEDDEAGTIWDGPLVVVTNKFSASASEIFAGAVQDYNRGIVVGDQTTHGKGTVQSLLDLKQQLFPDIRRAPNLGALKITMQQFYLPNGESTQKRGVIADIALPSTTNEMDIGEADLDYAVSFDKVPMAPHIAYQTDELRNQVIAELNARTRKRVDASEDFAKDLRRIERYKEQKERDSVSLMEEEFFQRRKELNADKEDEETFKKIDSGEDVVFDLEDHYDQEILKVTLDYLGLLTQR